MRGTYFNICPYCGANLDPGERCECQKKEQETKIIYYPARIEGQRKRPVQAV